MDDIASIFKGQFFCAASASKIKEICCKRNVENTHSDSVTSQKTSVFSNTAVTKLDLLARSIFDDRNYANAHINMATERKYMAQVETNI
jgi:hypothetical protein